VIQPSHHIHVLTKIKELIEDRMADALTLGRMVNENPCFRVLNEAGI
jgi:hypothetical protein